MAQDRPDAAIRVDRVRAAGGPLIKGFSGGGFRIDDNVYRALLITPSRADGWDPPALPALTEEALDGVLAGLPEFILLGTGATLRRPPRPLVASLEARGIGIEPMDSRAAARAWGVLRAEDRWVAGAFYPIDA